MDLINIVATSSCILPKRTDPLLTFSTPFRRIPKVLFENTPPPPQHVHSRRFLQKKLGEFVKISWELIPSDHIGLIVLILSTSPRNHWSWREK